MRLTVKNSTNDQVYSIEVDPSQNLEDLKVLIQVQSNMPIQDQELLYQNSFLPNDWATIGSVGLKDGDTVILQRKILMPLVGSGPARAAPTEETKRSDTDLLNDFFSAGPAQPT